MKYRILHIKYFSEGGRDRLPDGSHYQKGGYLHECELNAQKFRIPVAGYTLEDGIVSVAAISIFSAIMILPNDAVIEKEKIIDLIKNEFMLLRATEVHFSTGRYFYGEYGEAFNERSLCVGYTLRWKEVVIISARFLAVFKIENALIKDVEREQVFLIELK